MKFLCCETSTLLGSVAVFDDDRLLSYRESQRQGSHSEALNIFINDTLKEAGLKLSELDLFASGIGPGSFTGIRISLNTVKTFAYSFNKPTMGLNSLEILANQVPPSDRPIVAMLNAYKNMVYIATFKKTDELRPALVLKTPEVLRVQNLDQYINQTSVVVGDGYIAYSKYFSAKVSGLIERPASPSDEPQAKTMGKLVVQGDAKKIHWSELLPLYLRASEAEENKLGIKFQPLS